MKFEKNNPNPAARRDAVRELISSAPMGARPVEADIPLLADLAIHAIDDTVEHLFSLIKRAEPLFTDHRSSIMMTSLSLHVLAMQLNKIGDEMIEQAAAAAAVLASGGTPEDLARLRKEAMEEAKKATRR